MIQRKGGMYICYLCLLVLSITILTISANEVDFIEFTQACDQLSKTPPAFPVIEHPVKPKRIATPLTNHAIPTNSFGLNLLVDNGDMPIYAHPYSLRAPLQAPYGIITSMTQMRIFGDPVPDRDDSARYYLTPFTSALGICSIENAGITDSDDRFVVTQAGKASTHLLFPSQQGLTAAKRIDTSQTCKSLDDLIQTIPQGSMLIPVVRGMSYLTTILHDATPALYSSSVFLKANGKEIKDDAIIMGERFQLFLNNDETWVVYALDGAIRLRHVRNWKFNDGAEKYTSALIADAPYTGTIRVVKLHHRGDWSDFGPSVNHIQHTSLLTQKVMDSITTDVNNNKDNQANSPSSSIFDALTSRGGKGTGHRKLAITEREMNDPDFQMISEANTLFNRHVNTIPLGMTTKWYQALSDSTDAKSKQSRSTRKQSSSSDNIVSIRHHHRDPYVLNSNYGFEYFTLGMYSLNWDVLVHPRAYRADVQLHRKTDQLSKYDNQLLHYAFPHHLDSLGLPTADEHDEYHFIMNKMNVSDIYTGEHYDITHPSLVKSIGKLGEITSSQLTSQQKQPKQKRGGKQQSKQSGSQLLQDINGLNINDQLAIRYSIDGYSAIPTTITALSSTKGTMRAIIGNTWYLPEWIPKNEIISSLPLTEPRPETIAAITEALSHDVQGAADRAQNAVKVDGVYTSGKELYRLGQLCLVGKYLQENHKVEFNSKECAQALCKGLDMFRFGRNGNPLNRDTVWGGIIGAQGLREEHRLADFGNTMYNDHHFHFGYVIASASICAELSPAWVGQEGLLNKVFQNDNLLWVDSLIMDVSNPCHNQKDLKNYPFLRNFDPFVGHTWSQGLFPSWDGKDLESTSESLLYDYGVARWGVVTKRDGINYFGRLLTAIELRSFRKYFQMQAHDVIQQQKFEMLSDRDAIDDVNKKEDKGYRLPSKFYQDETNQSKKSIVSRILSPLFDQLTMVDPYDARGLTEPQETSLIPVSSVSVHPSKFARNISPGISFEGKVDHATWFGLNSEYIHGIQMLPQTPVLALVRPADFVHMEWENVVKDVAKSIKTGWKGILYLDYSTFDPQESYRVLGDYLKPGNEIDNGMSRTWSLFWTSSKPLPNVYRDKSLQITDSDHNQRKDFTTLAFPDVRMNKGFGTDPREKIQLRSVESPQQAIAVFSLDNYIETCALDLERLGLLNHTSTEVVAQWDAVKHLQPADGHARYNTRGNTNRYTLYDNSNFTTSWHSLPRYVQGIIIGAAVLVGALCIAFGVLAYVIYRRRQASGAGPEKVKDGSAGADADAVKPGGVTHFQAQYNPAVEGDFREPSPPRSPPRKSRDVLRQSPMQSPFTRTSPLPDLPRATVNAQGVQLVTSPTSPIDQENPASPVDSEIFSPKYGKTTARRSFFGE